MSRIRVLALLAAVLALGALLAACGGGGGGSTGSSESPEKVIESASLEGVKSGNFDLALNVDSEGKEAGEVKAEVSGPFEAGATKESLPQFEVQVKANGEASGEKVDFEGGLTLLTDRAFIGYKGSEYEVDPTTFGFVKSDLEQAQQQQAGQESGTTACQKAAEGVQLSKVMNNLSNDGSEEVDGTETTKVSGDLNVAGAIDVFTELLENPGCSSELEAAGPLPLGQLDEAKEELQTAIKKAHIAVWVGDDHIVRKVDAEVAIEPKGAAGEKVEVEFELSLSEVNEKQTFKSPSNAKPIEELFGQLGVNPLELIEGGGSGGLGGLLEGLSGGSMGGSSSGGGATELPSAPSSGAQQEFSECLQTAQTPTQLQKCAALLE